MRQSIRRHHVYLRNYGIWCPQLNFPKSPRIKAPGHGICAGISCVSQRPTSPFIRWLTPEQKSMIRKINDIIFDLNQGQFFWSSLHINFNTTAVEHVDANNDGPSLVISGGSHSGGEFYVRKDNNAEKTILPINGQPVITDGRLLHGHLPYEGQRCSIVAFTHSAFWHSTEKDKEYLSKNGFNYPTERCNESPPSIIAGLPTGGRTPSHHLQNPRLKSE